MTRPGFDEWMLEVAAAIALRSPDPSTKCGAIIVRPDRSIAATGYNGFPRNMEDREFWWEKREEKYDRVIHAEMNALLHSREDLRGYTIYISKPPCKDCAKHLAAAGIVKVVWKLDWEFHKRWDVDRAMQLLAETGVEVLLK